MKYPFNNFVHGSKKYINKNKIDKAWLKGYLNPYRILCIIAASLFFFIGYRLFLQQINISSRPVTGGIQGLSFIFSQIITPPGKGSNTLEAQNLNALILYLINLGLNIPFLIFSWLKLGKKFTFYTSLFLLLQLVFQLFFYVFPSWNQWLTNISLFPGGTSNSSEIDFKSFLNTITAAVIYAFGTILLYNSGSSGAGFDIISFNYSLKKGKNIGQFNIFLNSFVVGIGLLVTIIQTNNEPDYLTRVAEKLVYSAFYLIILYGIVDRKFPKQKKVFLQVYYSPTDNIEKAIKDLNSRFTYTIVEGIGGHSQKKQKIINMVITQYEAQQLIKTIKKVKPNCFITLTEIKDVHGHFVMYELD